MVDISVWITTYNHEEFIAEAIDSVLMQQTTFTYEIVIGEDCSTDGTREIVLRYQSQYPDKIRLLLPDTNLGMIPMTKASYALCTGRYIAWLDGDDYWTDSSKLQQQVDFLEANPTFSFCFHRVLIMDQVAGTTVDSFHPIYKKSDDTLSLKHFVHVYNPVHALSVVHRNVLGNPLPDWLFALPYPDWGLYLALAEHGEAKYFRQLMGVYRVHKNGSFSGHTYEYNAEQIIKFFTILKREFPKKEYSSAIDNAIYSYRKELFSRTLREFHLRKAARHGILLLRRS